MPACHQCEHQREIDKLNAETERLRSVCLACKGASKFMPGKGFSTIYLDGEECPEKVLAHRTDKLLVPGGSTVDLPEGVEEFLRQLLAEFSMLTDYDAVIVARMLRGQRITDIALDLGKSRASVHACWKRLTTRNPHFKALANGGIGKRGGGRKKGQFTGHMRDKKKAKHTADNPPCNSPVDLRAHAPARETAQIQRTESEM